ncbi:uncharacterized protein [Malus domestica]|uniref:uncharacterized protein n=1 Tax=Malus domestica TaxID=3750 RepID=UPI0039756F7E
MSNTTVIDKKVLNECLNEITGRWVLHHFQNRRRVLRHRLGFPFQIRFVGLHPHRPPPTAQPQLGFPELPGLKKRVFVQLGFQDSSSQKTKKLKSKNRIHISHTKRSFFFYCNLAKRYIKQYNAVELSALGMAIPTLITIAESLKSNGVAVEKSISTSTVVSKLDGEDGRIVFKAQLAILLGKAEELEETAVPVAAA